MTAVSWQQYEASDLGSAPEVDALLGGLGLGMIDRSGVAAFGGRNDNWAGATSTGAKVFVKRLPPGGTGELARSLDFERAIAGLPADSPLAAPRLLGHDEDTGLLAFELVDSPISGVELSFQDGFDEELCHRAGSAIATVHGLDPAGLENTQLSLPPVPWLDAMPWPAVQENSSAQLAAWQLVQDDKPVVEALRALRDRELTIAGTPVHGDLRFDQFILSGGRLYLCDWEQFRIADPARDVGAFVGEWLYHATYTIFAPPKGQDAFAGFGFSHQEIVERGQASLRRVFPRIAAFWAGYRAVRTPDPELAERALCFAGWHMYDRLIASAESLAQLNPVAKAAAGLGRSALLNPSGAAELVGLTEKERA